MNLLRLKRVTDRGAYSRSSHFNFVAAGLFTRPVKIGVRASAWPEYEVDVINSAKVAGWTEGEIQSLVTELHELRHFTPGMTDIEINAAVAKIMQRVRPVGPSATPV